jgi:hypothetical protein
MVVLLINSIKISDLKIEIHWIFSSYQNPQQKLVFPSNNHRHVSLNGKPSIPRTMYAVFYSECMKKCVENKKSSNKKSPANMK